MPAKNIECQLAQGQIGRYLRGDHISAEAVSQLEAHIADCGECTETLIQRRQAIMSMMGDKVPTRAVVEVSSGEEPKAAAPSASARLVAALSSATKQAKTTPEKGDAVSEPKPKTPFATKPILYSAGLAVVLLAMSYYSRSATSAFGPRAANLLPTVKQTPHPVPHRSHVTIPATPAMATVEPATRGVNTKVFHADNPAPAPHEPVSRPTHPKAPTKIVHHTISPTVTIHHRPIRRAFRHARRNQNTATLIRVYDAQGNPIHP